MVLHPMSNTKYKHHSGAIYTLICIANQTATKKEYVVTAVYQNESGEIFSRPLDEFLKNFTLVS